MNRSRLVPGCLVRLGLLVTAALLVVLLTAAGAVGKAIPPAQQLGTAGGLSGEVLRQDMQSEAAQAPVFKPRVLCFCAEWCGVCHRMKKAIAAARVRFADRVEFVGIDIDDPANAALVKRFEVDIIPSLFFVARNGQVVFAQLGYPGPEGLNRDVHTLIREDRHCTTSEAR
jgi:thioredoxin-like negative regulator of GroEL